MEHVDGKALWYTLNYKWYMWAEDYYLYSAGGPYINLFASIATDNIFIIWIIGLSYFVCMGAAVFLVWYSYDPLFFSLWWA